MSNRPTQITSTVIFLGNIPFDWDEPTVRSVVCGSGLIVDVRMGFEQAGKNKGYCFLEYLNVQEAQKAAGLLSQVRIMHPANRGQVKNLRVGPSNEGTKSSIASESKPVLTLDRSHLPSYVQIPPQMAANGPPVPPVNVPNSSNSPRLYQAPVSSSPPSQSIPQQSNTPMIGPQESSMPAKFTNADKILPKPQNLPFAIPDKVNETLSKQPPPQLIELVATLKNMLNGPEPSRVYDLLSFSPHFATSAAQALLLMGFIDQDVIQDSMKSASSTPVPQPPPQVPQPQYQQQVYPNQGYNNQYNQQPPPPPPSRWPGLPASAVSKLMAMPQEQAELIAKVLTLPVEEIGTLSPDKQSMVINLRRQYLS
ncbi:hinge domain of cleavage stimulation factor subunit 2-domain-containing protein [Scheffersomyces xylosifermentans]|uniref:hinge domain of cleavage stimulation factor subunit 2-domain-containing protein n=1 Tax=Scheffersomyces xylosifermentans TaxID=1304137 RepID=UPI00315CBF7F